MPIRRSGFILLAAWLIGALARPAAAQSAPVYNPANGHWYQLARASRAITWMDARALAGAMVFAGYRGHLATVTSVAENQFVSGYLSASGSPNPAWIGGYQDTTAPDYSEPAGGWRWVTGEPWSYTSWRSGEPSNSGGAENHLETYNDGTWNDTDLAATDEYLVEFEPQPIGGTAIHAALVLFPNPALGGQPALGQVTLAQPAGAGGEVLSLTSSNPAAAVVPTSVTVPAGASSVTFVITTLPVSTPTPVTIAAACAFGPVSAVLTVLPLPAPLPPAPAGVNLLVNGSFEAPAGGGYGIGSGLPGWQILKGTVDVVTAADWPPAPDGGSQSLDLVGTPGAAAIEQGFPTVPGLDYLLSGSVSHNPGVSFGRANFFLNGQFFAQLAHNLPSSQTEMQWQPFTYRFRATTAATTLTLSDVTGINDHQGTALDGLAVTLAPDQSPPLVTTATDLPAPTNLAARLVPGQGVQLAWQDNSSDENAFAVWRRTSSSDWTRVGVLAPNTTAFLDATVAPATSYTYRVRATRGNVASDWSNEVTVTTPAGP